VVGLRVLLLDDVVESGTTLRRVAEVLIEAGARSVHALVVTRTKSMSDTKVFIGGSRYLSRLSHEVRQRLDKIVESGLAVLVGDANGADKAVQSYLAARRYTNVVVFCMSDRCRNNIGVWQTRNIDAPAGAKGAAFYAIKDRAMAAEATHGLMLWDGDSKGTFANIVTLIGLDKPVVVFFAPKESFVNDRTRQDIARLLDECGHAAAARFERELDSESRAWRFAG
jgi:hypothetical protein